MQFVVVGLSHHSAPVSARERLAFSDTAIPVALEKLRQSGAASEAVILSTCNRVEIFAVSEFSGRQAVAALRQFLFDFHGRQEEQPAEVYGHGNLRALEHLFKVASGLDSMVLGETEILGQVKKAYEASLQLKHTGGRLNKFFQTAFNVAKHIRTHTNIQRGSVSVGSVAVELAQKIFSSLAEHQVMVIGAGDTSEKTARALLSRGAHSIIVSNRSHDRAVALAQELGGRAIHFDQWLEEFPAIDIIVSSTSAPHHVITPRMIEPLMKARKNRPLLLIDLAVPRDIDPEIKLLDQVYLYNIDDLQEIADGYLTQRKEEIVRCNAIISQKARLIMGAVLPEAAGDSQLLFENG